MAEPNQTQNSIPQVDTGKPANPAADKPLGDVLFPKGADNEAGGGTGQSTTDVSAKAEGDPAPAQPEPEPKPEPAEEPKPEPKEGETEAAEPAPLTAESYTDLKLPEGFEVDDKSMSSFKTLAAKNNIPPEAAQELLALYGDTMKQYAESAQAAQAKAWTDMTTKWTSDLNALPEFQGERRAQTETILGTILEEFGGPDKGAQLKAELNATWMGDNPRLVKLILDMGQALVEDEPIPTGAPTGAESRRGRTLGSILYPAPTTN